MWHLYHIIFPTSLLNLIQAEAKAWSSPLASTVLSHQHPAGIPLMPTSAWCLHRDLTQAWRRSFPHQFHSAVLVRVAPKKPDQGLPRWSSLSQTCIGERERQQKKWPRANPTVPPCIWKSLPGHKGWVKGLPWCPVQGISLKSPQSWQF